MLLFIYSPEGAAKGCGKRRKCSKEKGHVGKCNSKRDINTFWQTSPVYGLNKKRQSLQESFCELKVKEEALTKTEQNVLALQRETEAQVKESGNLK